MKAGPVDAAAEPVYLPRLGEADELVVTDVAVQRIAHSSTTSKAALSFKRVTKKTPAMGLKCHIWPRGLLVTSS